MTGAETPDRTPVGRTPSATRSTTSRSCSPNGNREIALHDLLDFCRELDLRFEWGAIGTSIRVKTPFKDEPISIAWVFPDGGRRWDAQGCPRRLPSTGSATSLMVATGEHPR